MSDQNKTPIAFWIISVFALLWNLYGAFQCWTEYGYWANPKTRESLGDLAEPFGAIYDATPGWIFVVFALAILTGILGAVALLIKKKVAAPLFLISTLCTIIHFGYFLFATESVALMGPSTYIMPMVVITLDIFFWWYAKRNVESGILV